MKRSIFVLISLFLCAFTWGHSQKNIEYGEGTISLKAPDGKEALFLGNLKSGGGGVFVENPLGKDAVILRSSQSDQGGQASFANKEGEERALIGSIDNVGYLELFNEQGKEAVILGCGDNGKGFIEIGEGEQTRAYLGEAAQGNSGLLSLYHKSGKASAQIGSYNHAGYLRLFYEDGPAAFEVLLLEGQPTVLINGERTHDYAEVFELADRAGIEPGTVVSMAGDGAGLLPSQQAYDPAAVGVISGAGDFRNGINLGTRKDGSRDLPVALSGQVYVKVNLQGGKIKVGDLLVASDTPGEAMKAQNRKKAFGAVIGKALGSYNGHSEDGLVLMLVMVR